jgi:plasmid maintenance system antidote protein VapI
MKQNWTQVRAKRKQIDVIHAAFERSQWTMTKLAREAGVEKARVAYFIRHRQATCYTAGRLAIALVGFYRHES